MAHDPGLAETLRADLDGLNIREQAMFGGICFMLDGHMLCGAMSDHGMFRVGAGHMAAATAHDGVAPVQIGARRMTCFVRAPLEVAGDDAVRSALLALARDFVGSLPPR